MGMRRLRERNPETKENTIRHTKDCEIPEEMEIKTAVSFFDCHHTYPFAFGEVLGRFYSYWTHVRAPTKAEIDAFDKDDECYDKPAGPLVAVLEYDATNEAGCERYFEIHAALHFFSRGMDFQAQYNP